MPSGWKTTYAATILDAQLANGDYIAYSENGTSETSHLARTAIGAWSSAVAGSPATKANANALTTAAVITAQSTISHFAIYSASTSGTQKTEWTALSTPRTLAVGESGSWAIGALVVSEE